MTTIETKQNEMDAKFASMLDINMFIFRHFDIKLLFFEFVGGRRTRKKLFRWNQILPLNNNYNHLNIDRRKHQGS
jgi:hypothetical protein